MTPTETTQKILIVDDEISLAQLYSQELQAEGYTTLEANDGESALELAKSFAPDLILLDLMMPGMSGFDTIDLLRSSAPTNNTKIIIMSGLGQEDDIARAKSMGADDYIVKGNVPIEQIVALVKRHLATSRSDSPAA